MAIKGGKTDASGEKINSFRLVTDADANAGLGDVNDPLRVDPTGTTVQPVQFNSAQHVIVDSGGGGGTQYTEGTTQATATGTVALGKNASNVVSALPLTANGLKTDGSAVTQPVSIAAAVTVQQATAANLKVDLSGTAANATAIKVDGSAVTQPVSLAAETTKVIGTARVLGNGGAALDATVGAGAAPANGVAVLGVANTAAPAPTNGQTIAIQLDSKGNVRVSPYGNVGSFTSQSNSPAAGNNVSLTVPAATKWILKTFNLVLTTSSTVATRTMVVTVKDAGGSILYAGTAGVTQAASLTQRYIYGPSLPLSASVTGGGAYVPCPEMCLGPSFNIASLVTSLQTGDTVTLFCNVVVVPD